MSYNLLGVVARKPTWGASFYESVSGGAFRERRRICFFRERQQALTIDLQPRPSGW
jgi:hypothetical protein